MNLAAIRQRDAKPFDANFLSAAENDRHSLLAHIDAVVAALEQYIEQNVDYEQGHVQDHEFIEHIHDVLVGVDE